MAVIKSGASTDQWTIDSTSKAGRVTLYDASGNPLTTVAVSGAVNQGSPNTVANGWPVKVTDGTNVLGTSANPIEETTQSESPTGSAVPAEATYIAGNKAGVLTGVTLDANNNLGVNISDIGGNVAVAKGTQGAAAVTTQDFKDAGRSKVILTLTKALAITTEALVTLTQKKGDATTTTGTFYTVTAGKTLRLQSMFISITSAAASISSLAVRLREGASGGGAVTVTSDIIAELEVSNPAAAIAASGQSWFIFPDGLELAGGQQIGVSELSNLATGSVTIVVVGYEY